jgi:hypothetical protein
MNILSHIVPRQGLASAPLKSGEMTTSEVRDFVREV